jgi:hypothetical protein
MNPLHPTFKIVPISPAADEISDPDSPPSHDFRAQQILHLEQLQRVLDENNELRAKFTSLQVQVIPLDSPPHPLHPPEDTEPPLSPEEVELLKSQLERTVSLYGAEVSVAAKLNQTLERQHREFSDLKMQLRLVQDERMMHQNSVAASGLAKFKLKAQRLRESWANERRGFESIANYLRGLATVAEKDIEEFEEQQKSNLKGIQRLTKSIVFAKQDLNDFRKEREAIAIPLQEFAELEIQHQEAELRVVTLGNELDALQTRVETDSLTARVRKRLNDSQKSIDGLNGMIDALHCKVAEITVQTQHIRDRITELDAREAVIARDTREVRVAMDR